MQITSLGYRTDVMIRVREGAELTEHDGCLVVRSPANPGFWWGNFLLLAGPPAPGAAAEWVTRFPGLLPGARHVAVGVDVTGADAVETAGFEAAGCAVKHSTVLTAVTVHEPPRPSAGATVRPLEGDSDWEQAARLRNDCTGLGPGSEEYLRGRVAQARALTEAGYGTWFGAFLDGRLVAQLGVVRCDGGLARFQDVETHPAARRQGLAGTLVCQAGRYGLAGLGAATLVIVADEPGPIRIYRSVGFTPVEDQVGFERPPAGSGQQAAG